MEQLIYAGKIVGAIVTIGGFIAGILVTIRKFVHLMDKVEELIEEKDKENKDIKILKQEVEDQKEEEKRSHDLLLSIARRQLLESFNKVLLDKKMSQETFVVISALYNSYVKNGGNSVICDMWNVIIQDVEIVGKENR